MTDEPPIEEWKRALEYSVGKLDKSPNFPGPRRKIHAVVDEMEQYLHTGSEQPDARTDGGFLGGRLE